MRRERPKKNQTFIRTSVAVEEREWNMLKDMLHEDGINMSMFVRDAAKRELKKRLR